MSFYATMVGRVVYTRNSAFSKATQLLTDGGWLDKADRLMYEDRVPVTSRPCIDRRLRMLRIPLACYRNLCCIADKLLIGGFGWILWTSTDGCMVGGLVASCQDGASPKIVTKEYDLFSWGVRAIAQPPRIDDDFEEYCNWQEIIMTEFLQRATHAISAAPIPDGGAWASALDVIVAISDLP